MACYQYITRAHKCQSLSVNNQCSVYKYKMIEWSGRTLSPITWKWVKNCPGRDILRGFLFHNKRRCVSCLRVSFRLLQSYTISNYWRVHCGCADSSCWLLRILMNAYDHIAYTIYLALKFHWAFDTLRHVAPLSTWINFKPNMHK